jgi:hypothetical protein
MISLVEKYDLALEGILLDERYNVIIGVAVIVLGNLYCNFELVGVGVVRRLY